MKPNYSFSPQKSKTLSSQMRSGARNMSFSVNNLPPLPQHNASIDSLGHEIQELQKPTKSKDPFFARMSGIVDPMNTTGLYAEISTPTRPSIYCVRCSAVHASVCMPCADLMCEQTLTFYRKTRAAGAAALFTKAFVEAGNSKLVKFFIFRLLKNSYEARSRANIKMKTVIERLFGSNIVHMPFSAWRRYTKENIVARKEKTIQTLHEKITALETQVNKLFAENKKQEDEIERLRLASKHDTEERVHHTKQIVALKDLLLKERERVVGLSNLAHPLNVYSTLTDALIQKESNEVRAFLHHNATNLCSHNFSHIFKPTVLNDVARIYRENEHIPVNKSDTFQGAGMKNIVVNPTDEAIKMQLLLDWFSTTSYNAGQHVEKSTGKSFGIFLPSCEKIPTLNDISSGRDLIRVVVNLIMEYKRHYDSCYLTNINTQPSTKSPVKGKKVEAVKTARIAVDVSLADLQYIKKHTNNPFELIELAIKLARHALNIPDFKPAEIYQGKTHTIYALVMSLIMCSDPVINLKESAELGEQMNRYQEFNMIQAQILEDKESVQHLNDITHMLHTHLSVMADIEQGTNNAIRRHLTGLTQETVSSDVTPSRMGSPRVMGLLDAIIPPENSYKQLGRAIDLFISNNEQYKLNQLSKENQDVCSDYLFELIAQSAVLREKRETGLKMTTELKQFMLCNYLEASAVHGGLVVGSTLTSSTSSEVLFRG